MKSKIPFRALCLCALALSAAGLTACSTSGSSRPPGADENQSASAYQHVVQSGETLGMIADWYTGRSSNWKLILESNPGLRPERLRLGQIILIPRDLLIKDTPIPKGYSKKTKTTLPSGNATGIDADKSAAAVDSTAPAVEENKLESQPAAMDSGTAAVEEVKSTIGETGSEDSAKIEDAANDSKAQAEAAAKAAEEAAAAARAEAERAAQKAQADAEAAAKAAADAAEGAKKQPNTTPDDAEREKLLDELLAQ